MTKPKSVAIVAMGASHGSYTRLVSVRGCRRKVADETWAINAMGDCILHDRMFMMDDFKLVLEVSAEAHPESAIVGMLAFGRKHPGPIYTSRPYPEYPGAVIYPLEDVIRSIGHSYLNTTVAYAVAFAIHLGVEELQLYGCDFTYKDHHMAERGRACVEFLLALAMARGVRVVVAGDSTLMDANVPEPDRLYGYAGKVEVLQTDDGLRVRSAA